MAEEKAKSTDRWLRGEAPPPEYVGKQLREAVDLVKNGLSLPEAARRTNLQESKIARCVSGVKIPSRDWHIFLRYFQYALIFRGVRPELLTPLPF